MFLVLMLTFGLGLLVSHIDIVSKALGRVFRFNSDSKHARNAVWLLGPKSLVFTFFVLGLTFSFCQVVPNLEDVETKKRPTVFVCGVKKIRLRPAKHLKKYSPTQQDKQRFEKLRDALQSDVEG